MTAHTIAIVCSQFNADITSQMREYALARAKKKNMQVKNVLFVPGAFEIPLAVQKLLGEKDVEGVVALGVIKQGKTSHDEVIAHACANALMRLMLEHRKPVALGVSGPRMTLEQARERAQPFAEHAVDAVAHMIEELKK